MYAHKRRSIETIIAHLKKNSDMSNHGCWLFQGAKEHGGHCKIRFNDKKVFIHRLSAHYHWGFDLESPILILHKCNTHNCWNPDHLYEGTHKDNTQDSIAHETFHFTEVTTHCPQGHEYTEENTAINSTSGKKYCKQCNRERAAKYRSENERPL